MPCFSKGSFLPIFCFNWAIELSCLDKSKICKAASNTQLLDISVSNPICFDSYLIMLKSHSTLQDLEFILLFFFSGPRLPKAIIKAAMVSLGKKVILLGGYPGYASDYPKDIYELSSPNGDWLKLPQTLKKARGNFVAFTIPNNWKYKPGKYCW